MNSTLRANSAKQNRDLCSCHKQFFKAELAFYKKAFKKSDRAIQHLSDLWPIRDFWSTRIENNCVSMLNKRHRDGKVHRTKLFFTTIVGHITLATCSTIQKSACINLWVRNLFLLYFAQCLHSSRKITNFGIFQLGCSIYSEIRGNARFLAHSDWKIIVSRSGLDKLRKIHGSNHVTYIVPNYFFRTFVRNTALVTCSTIQTSAKMAGYITCFRFILPCFAF